MANQVTTYQCPNCTAPLAFDVASGKLQCEFCESSFLVEQIELLMAETLKAAADAEQNHRWDTSELNTEWGIDANDMRVYSCPSCGAQLICDASTAATSCPYCLNPTVIPAQFKGILRPDYVLPFQITKDQAIEHLKEHFKGKYLLPKRFTAENTLREVKGMYVPFWLFDGEVAGKATYSATSEDYIYRGDDMITETSVYRVRRSGTVKFEKIPVDASSKMDNSYMDSIEPYDYKELKPFAMSYLPGFLADKYDVSVEACSERADERAKSTASASMYNSAASGYASCTLEDETLLLRRGKVHYGLLPVWLLSAEWAGKPYLFAVNGQTGKTVGDLPMNIPKLVATFAAIAGSLIAVGSAVVALLL